MGELDVLLQALRHFDDPAAVLQQVAAQLSAAAPGALAFCCIYRHQPAVEIAFAAAAMSGSESLLDGRLREAFAQSGTLFDRWATQYEQRNRWIAGNLTSVAGSALAAFWGDAPMAFWRIVICEGARPIAYMSLARETSFPLSKSVRERAKGLGRVLRASSVLWASKTAPVSLGETLLRGADGVVISSATGRLLTTSPGAAALLRQGSHEDVVQLLASTSWRDGVSHRLRALRVDLDSFAGAESEFRIARVYADGCTPPAPPINAVAGGLTPRERELVAELALGGTNKELALRLGLAPSTVKSMLERVFSKVEVSSRSELLRWALLAQRRPG